jgi:AcrR family transcriptional regulator
VATPETDEVGRAGTPAQGRELRARGRRTMQKLLDAGEQVFSAKGYHAARVDDIVKVARTSHGTFYLYFSNKEDLFAALIGDVADQLTELTEQMAPITADDAGRDALRAWLRRFAELYERHGAVIGTWTEAESEETPIGGIGTEVLGKLADSFSERIARAAPPDIDADIAALACVAMVERFTYFVHSDQIAADRDHIVDTLAGVTHAGLFGSP